MASTYHLVCQNQDRLQAKLAVVTIEDLFKGRAQELKNHDIVIAFCSEPANRWDTDATCKALIDAVFVLELGILHINGLKFDGNILFRNNIDCMVNNTYNEFSRWQAEQ
jgi:hypothetical protein